MGGGSQRERKYGRSGKPEPDPYVGTTILLPGIWKEGSLQLPPSPASVFKEYYPPETLRARGGVKASPGGSADAPLLAYQLDKSLASKDSLRTAARFSWAATPSMGEALRNLATLSFVVFHLFPMGSRHLSAVAEILHLIKRL